jgi:hypothetical protein
MTTDEEVVNMLRDISNKFYRLPKALTGHWKDEAAMRRERCW